MREWEGGSSFPWSKSQFSDSLSYLKHANANYLCLSPSIRSRTTERIIMKSDLEEICEILSSNLNFYSNYITGQYISPTPTFVSDVSPRVHSSRDQNTLLCQKNWTQSEITRIKFSILCVWSPLTKRIFGSFFLHHWLELKVFRKTKMVENYKTQTFKQT